MNMLRIRNRNRTPCRVSSALSEHRKYQAPRGISPKTKKIIYHIIAECPSKGPLGFKFCVGKGYFFGVSLVLGWLWMANRQPMEMEPTQRTDDPNPRIPRIRVG
jgi:hypothetical protein